MKSDPRERLLKAIQADGRYPPQAFEFLHLGLEYTTRKAFGDDPGREPRHVSGQELCEGLRELAVQRWGLLAKVVLRQWNIRRTRDFGEMVYFLIELGMMGRQDSDCVEDFDNVYDFNQAFDSYHITLDADEE